MSDIKKCAQNADSELNKLLNQLVEDSESDQIRPETQTESENFGNYQLPVRNTKGGMSIDEEHKPWIIGTYLPNQFVNPRHPGGHFGLDLASEKGVPVYPIAPGVVIETATYPKGGKTLKIAHEDGQVVSYYAHLHRVLVSKGEDVNFNTVIGEMGNTGNAKDTAPHLHLEVKINNKRVDPQKIIGQPIGSLSKKAAIILDTLNDLNNFTKSSLKDLILKLK